MYGIPYMYFLLAFIGYHSAKRLIFLKNSAVFTLSI